MHVYFKVSGERTVSWSDSEVDGNVHFCKGFVISIIWTEETEFKKKSLSVAKQPHGDGDSGQ